MNKTRPASRDILITMAVVVATIALGFMSLIVARPLLRQQGLIVQLCMLDRATVFQHSAIGISANKQLATLKDRLQDAIDTEKSQIDDAGDTSNAAARLARLQARARQENVQLEQIRQTVISMIIGRIAPIVRRDAARASCSAIIDRSAFVDFGNSSDLTEQLVKDINREVPPLPSNALSAISSTLK